MIRVRLASVVEFDFVPFLWIYPSLSVSLFLAFRPSLFLQDMIHWHALRLSIPETDSEVRAPAIVTSQSDGHGST